MAGRQARSQPAVLNRRPRLDTSLWWTVQVASWRHRRPDGPAIVRSGRGERDLVAARRSAASSGHPTGCSDVRWRGGTQPATDGGSTVPSQTGSGGAHRDWRTTGDRQTRGHRRVRCDRRAGNDGRVTGHRRAGGDGRWCCDGTCYRRQLRGGAGQWRRRCCRGGASAKVAARPRRWRELGPLLRVTLSVFPLGRGSRHVAS